MKLRMIALVSTGLFFSGTVFAADAAATSTLLKSEQDKVSYTIGVDMGDNFRAQGIDVNPEILAKGVADGLAGADTLLTKEQMEETLLNFQKQLLAERENKLKEEGATNLKIGQEFLAKNKQQKGVVSLEDGLQYKIVKEGKGVKPTDSDSVTVNYVGYLVDPKAEDGLGKEFDSSIKRGQPATFPVTGVIPGWTEALKLMPTGSTWFIYVPANLAYGEHAVGPIGPNETLIFKVDLLETKPAAPEDNATQKSIADNTAADAG